MRAALVVTVMAVTSHSIALDKELTDSPDFRVRVQAALRLGRTGPGARADLESGLRDSHPAVRVACAAGLGTINSPESIPALDRALKVETYATVKQALQETIDKIKNGGGKGGGSDAPASLANARYVVQLGAMKNNSGTRGADLDTIMRQAARAKAGTIKGAVIVDGHDAAVVRKATEKNIPVLLVDGNLTKLTQSTGTDGAIVISAKVDMAVRKLPQQTLKGTVSGSAAGSPGTRTSPQILQEMQNRVVGGAVESAVGSMGAELAAFVR